MKTIYYQSTDACNLCCTNCEHSKTHQIQDDQFLSVLSSLSKLHPSQIDIFGGEPTMDPFLVTKLKVLRQHCLHTHLSLHTNGTIPFDYGDISGLINTIHFYIQTDTRLNKIERFKQVIENIRQASHNHHICIHLIASPKSYQTTSYILHQAKILSIQEVQIIRQPFCYSSIGYNGFILNSKEISTTPQTHFNNYTSYTIPYKEESDKQGSIIVTYHGEVYLKTGNTKEFLGDIRKLQPTIIEDIIEATNTPKPPLKYLHI